MDFFDAKSLLDHCTTHNLPISEVMIAREQELYTQTREQLLARMQVSYDIMKASALKAQTEDVKSIGGLIGGEAKKLNIHREKGLSICGTVVSKAISYSMGVLEVNASMGLIVAAPTGGSCGVLPGVLLSLQEEFNLPEDKMILALFNAAAIGFLFMRNATVAGAEGGCQAEVGAASAMAASAVTELMGGTPEQCLSAAAQAISGLLGLVCDPIAGLVESPCQGRNAVGASNALLCAEIALSGINYIIPLDEMIKTMYEVGRTLPMQLRETALGGIAATPTACALCEKIFGGM